MRAMKSFIPEQYIRDTLRAFRFSIAEIRNIIQENEGLTKEERD